MVTGELAFGHGWLKRKMNGICHTSHNVIMH
jgi:hypothetical protein